MKRVLVVLLNIGLVLTVLFSIYVAMKKNSQLEQNTQAPLITWIDDDTAEGLFVNAYDLANRLGIKMTFACITGRLTDETEELLLKYQDEGFQIVSHSESHDNTNIWGSNYAGDYEFDAEAAEEDLQRSIVTLEEAGFKNCAYFVVPGGVETPELVEIARKYSPAMIVGQYSGLINRGDEIERYCLHREFIDVTQHKKAKYYKDLIDETIKCNGWLILGTHSSIPEQWDADLIEEVLQYAIDAGVEIKPLGAAYNAEREYILGEEEEAVYE